MRALECVEYTAHGPSSFADLGLSFTDIMFHAIAIYFSSIARYFGDASYG